MSEVARAVVYERPEVFSMRELPLPEIGPEEMLLEVLLAGIDGTEVHTFHGKIEMFNNLAPIILGDEIVGRVVRIGDQAKKIRGLDVGDRIIVEARWPCNRCDPCLRGNYYICQNDPRVRTGYGSMPIDTEWPGLWGGFASHVYVPPQALVYKLRDDMETKTALLACSVLANGIRWTSFGNIRLGSKVVVFGPGPQGLACVLAARHRGAEVISVGLESDSARLASAKEFGAAATVALPAEQDVQSSIKDLVEQHGPIDVCIDAAGYPSSKQIALGAVRVMGSVISPAVPTPQVQPLDWYSMMFREISLFQPRGHAHTVGQALDLAHRLKSTDGIDVGDQVTHILPLEQATEAIRIAGGETDERPVKVALSPELVG